MLDINLLRKDTESIVNKLKKRGFDFNGQEFLELEQARKTFQINSENLKSDINSTSKSIGLRMSKGEDAIDEMEKVLKLKAM